jgi:hypothetical protein
MHIIRSLYAVARHEMEELAGGSSSGAIESASNLQDARRAFILLATELSTQFSLGYYPTNKSHDGKYRSIRVEVHGTDGRTKVHAREGYYALKEVRSNQ